MVSEKNRRVTLYAIILAVTTGVYVSAMSVVKLSRFLAGFDYYPSGNSPTDTGIYFMIIVNWILASSYLYLPSLVECIVQKIGTLCGLPECYFKFIKIVLLLSTLNIFIANWQKVPEIYLWNLNIRNAETIHFYLHSFLWIIMILIVVAIDITEIMGLKSILNGVMESIGFTMMCFFLCLRTQFLIFYYHIMNGSRCSLSQQYDSFLLNMGLPGSSCLIIILWTQTVMSFDRLLLAVIWTLGILSSNQTDDKDIKYIAKQIERKKRCLYFSEKIVISPLK